jgi:hypothetical protein
MDNFLSLLEFTFWALNVSGLRTRVVKVTGSGERSSELGDFAGSFINGDDVTSHDLLLLDRFNHFSSEIINGFHLGGLQSDLSSLGSRLDGFINFDFDDFSFNNFGLFSNSYTYKKSKIKVSFFCFLKFLREYSKNYGYFLILTYQ